MRVLVGCEESQTVCKAFRALGVEAYSNDLQECSGGHPEWHLQMDALVAIEKVQPDLMVCHPPCTYFANAGLHYLKTKPERRQQLKQSFDFLLALWNAQIDYIALENPIGWLNTNWMKPTQIIQPYYFGDAELKTTCLWLKNLPPLVYGFSDTLFSKRTATDPPKPTGYVIRKSGAKAGQRYNYYFRQGKTAKARSKTFPSVANAMATQWTEYILNQKQKRA